MRCCCFLVLFVVQGVMSFVVPPRSRMVMLDTGGAPVVVSSRALVESIRNHKTDRLVFSSDLHHILSVDKETGLETITETHPLVASKVLEDAFQNNVLVDVDSEDGRLKTVGTVLQALFYVPFIYIGFNILGGILRGGIGGGLPRPGGGGPGGSPFSILEKPEELSIPAVSLEEWAGSPEVKRECAEIVSFLENRSRYEAIGAKVPKGVLLEGPPGTGKTLLAKAIASEANANFISISGSEFVELYVGLGAARVRQMFKDARKRKPCILFIDEIDAVGRQRGAGINMGNDEREQTLNQLLSEMDGFKENEDIIVIAATNRRDVLDAALLRPGRFDRIVAVPLPDFSSRVKVLETHARSKKLGPVSLELIAEQTAGFSGADLQNLLNEAALLSVRNNLTEISRDTIMQALEKTMVGVKKETDTRSLDTKQRVAIHEAGHAVIALLFPEYFNFVKVTIQNTYSGAGGYTIFTDNHEIAENGLYTKDYLKKRLRVLLGGRAAESLLYGDDFVSVGAMEDLRQAALLSRRMINQFGMGEQLENYCNPYDNGDNPFVGRMVGTGNQVSEDLAASIDKEALFLVKDAYQETRKLLKEKESLMTLITEGLIKKNTLYPEDIITTF